MAPIEEGMVARILCSRCGAVIEIHLKIPKKFFTKYYFCFKGCYDCCDDENPPDSYTIQRVTGKGEPANLL